MKAETKVHIKQDDYTGPTHADSVMKRIQLREQAKVRANGTQSASWRRFDARRPRGGGGFTRDTTSDRRAISRCVKGR